MRTIEKDLIYPMQGEFESIFNDLTVLPHNSLLKFISNFDDYYYGWEICPEPGELLIFQISLNDNMVIRIARFTVNYYECKAIKKILFSGTVPANKDKEPDFEFLKQILRNYKNIG